ncbi:MAG: DegV family protein [Clostridia bacterium]|nr:DegV family protein [Clostridia bacterium]
MAESFRILADVTCDLDESVRAKYGIEYLNGHFTYPGGEGETHLSWDKYPMFPNCSPESFYKMLNNAPDDYTTAPPNAEAFAAYMTECAKAGEALMVVTISSGMSGTYAFASSAAERVQEAYPEFKVRVVDSRRFSACMGLECIIASEMRGAGKSLDDAADCLEANRLRLHQMGWHDGLSFVAKKGRITHSKAFMGTLIGIKSIGECSDIGLTTPIGKVPGEKKAFKALIGYIAKTIEEPEKQTIVIANTVRRKQAETYKALIEENFHPKAVIICDVFPACGINMGPGLVAAYYLGKPMSPDLSAETALLAECIAAK